MPAVFHVADIFVFESRRLFVLIGKVGDGMIRERMKIKVDGHPEVSLPIVDVGLVKKIGDRGVVALSTPYRDAAELSFLQSLSLAGTTISIEDASVA